MTPPLKTVEAGGRTLSYREAGDGHPLVLLHGIGSGSASWEAQLAALSDAWRVIAWDAPGYGGSDPLPGETPAVTAYADAVTDLLDALGLDQIDLVGHSLGALIAGCFAARRGGRVRRLLLADVAAGYAHASDELRIGRLEARLEAMDTLGPEGLARERSKVLLSPDAPAAALEKVQAVQRTLHPEGYKQAARMLHSSDIFDFAGDIAAPTMVVCGSADTVTPEEGVRKVAEAIAGASYRSLEGLGHACYVEGPDAFNAAVRDFMAVAA